MGENTTPENINEGHANTTPHAKELAPELIPSNFENNNSNDYESVDTTHTNDIEDNNEETRRRNA